MGSNPGTSVLIIPSTLPWATANDGPAAAPLPPCSSIGPIVSVKLLLMSKKLPNESRLDRSSMMRWAALIPSLLRLRGSIVPSK